MSDKARIRELNDAFRRSLTGGTVVLTAGVAALPDPMKAQVLDRVMSFTDFDGDNDPHKEHDLGTFEIEGESYAWKIDYYNEEGEGLSEDPSDLEKTTRVLTIMLAEEF